MVSTWRFWSGKEINFSRTQPFQLLAVLAIVAFVLIRFSSGALFLLALAYMFSGIWARAAYSWSRRRRRQKPSLAGEAPVTSAAAAPRFSEEYARHSASDAPRAVWPDDRQRRPREALDTEDPEQDLRRDEY